MHRAEEARLRGGSPAAARERKHLALCIKNQVGDAVPSDSGVCHCCISPYLCVCVRARVCARGAARVELDGTRRTHCSTCSVLEGDDVID